MEQVLLAMQAAPSGPAGASYFGDLLRSLVVLAAVCAAAIFGLRWLARRGFGLPGGGRDGAVTVLQRVPLEPRKSLYVVRAGARVLLIGTGEAGPPALIAELDPKSVEQGTLEVRSTEEEGARKLAERVSKEERPS